MATPKFKIIHPFASINVGQESTPTFADIDGDGDLDLIVGNDNSRGRLKYYQNTGNSSAPVYVTTTANPFTRINVGEDSIPTFADIDGDGDFDLIVGERNGTLRYYQNTGNSPHLSMSLRLRIPSLVLMSSMTAVQPSPISMVMATSI
jgi:hypothetical protein